MAFTRNSGNYGNNYGNSYQRSGYSKQAQQPPKEPFNLDQWVDELIDICLVIKGKAEQAGLELPADNIARWATSAKIAMDKDN